MRKIVLLVAVMALFASTAAAQTQDQPQVQAQVQTQVQADPTAQYRSVPATLQESGYEVYDGRFAGRPQTQTTQSFSLSLPSGVGVHYAYEHPLGRMTSITGRVGLDAGAAWGQNVFGGSYSYWMVAPSVDIEPRFYYGFDRREAHGRSTEGNAGSFLALNMKTIFPFGYISDPDMYIVGGTVFTPQWGMRRVWGGGWLFELTVGANFGVNWSGGVATSPHVGLRFGYAF